MDSRDTPVGLADLFAEWLAADYWMETGYGGEAALAALDDRVDVVLLDRRMPDLSGDAVLTEIRERGLDCCVALVTAVDPDFDIVDLGFDAYVTKPVTSDDLTGVVETLLARKDHESGVQRYFQLAAKRAALEAQFGEDVAGNPKYDALTAEIEAVKGELNALASGFGEDDFEVELGRLARDAGVESPGPPAALNPRGRRGRAMTDSTLKRVSTGVDE